MIASGADPACTLDEEIIDANQLLQLLRLEQAQLIAAEIGKLEKLIVEKTTIIGRLFALAKLRHSNLSAIGFHAGEAGMEAWLGSLTTSYPGLGSIRKRWDELIALTYSAKELNRVNGLLIGSHMARNQTALNALHSNADKGNFYGPDGHPSRKQSGRGLVIS